MLGHAGWFFGNLYEAIVKVPDLLAPNDAQRRNEQALSPVDPGSPVRYYAAAMPATFPAACSAVSLGWDEQRSRPWLITASACSIAGGAATAYLVRTVNLRLFFSTQPLDVNERETLLRTWYRVNLARIVLTGAAYAAARQAKSRLLK